MDGNIKLQPNLPVTLEFSFSKPQTGTKANNTTWYRWSVTVWEDSGGVNQPGDQIAWFAPNDDVAAAVQSALEKCEQNNLPMRLEMMVFMMPGSKFHFHALGLPAGSGIIVAPSTYRVKEGAGYATKNPILPPTFNSWYDQRKDKTVSNAAAAASVPPAQQGGVFDVEQKNNAQAAQVKLNRFTNWMSALDVKMTSPTIEFMAMILYGLFDRHWQVASDYYSDWFYATKGLDIRVDADALDEADTKALELELKKLKFETFCDALRNLPGNVSTLLIEVGKRA